jgi:hypothetical protein
MQNSKKNREGSNQAGLKLTSHQFVDKSLQNKSLLVSNNLPELEKGRALNYRFRPKESEYLQIMKYPVALR